MSYNLKFLQSLSSYSLAGAGVAIGATSIILKSFKDIDGNAITMAEFGTIGYATLEPGNSNLEEQISFTGITNNANGTSTLTGVSNVAFYYPYTATSGLLKTHAGATQLVISNTSAFYQTIIDYINGIAIAGAPDSSTLVKGIGTVSVAPVSATAPIFVGDNDPRLLGPSLLSVVGPYIYPVNSIYMTISPTNPATTFGFGTWVAWGTGEVPVGVDVGQTEFNTVEKTGGEKTHVLITAELAAHTHSKPNTLFGAGSSNHFGSSGSYGGSDGTATGSAGSDTAHK